MTFAYRARAAVAVGLLALFALIRNAKTLIDRWPDSPGPSLLAAHQSEVVAYAVRFSALKADLEPYQVVGYYSDETSQYHYLLAQYALAPVIVVAGAECDLWPEVLGDTYAPLQAAGVIVPARYDLIVADFSPVVITAPERLPGTAFELVRDYGGGVALYRRVP